MSAKLTLEQAKQYRRCRICGEPVNTGGGLPVGWMEEFGRMTYPARVTLNFGKELAHTECLEQEVPGDPS